MGLYSEIDLGSLATFGSSGLRVEEVLLLLALTLSFDWLKGVLPVGVESPVGCCSSFSFLL